MAKKKLKTKSTSTMKLVPQRAEKDGDTAVATADALTPDGPALPPTTDVDPQARVRSCSTEINDALRRHRCQLLPYFGRPEPIGEDGSKLMLTALFGIRPLAMLLLAVVLAGCAGCKSSIDVTAARDFKDAVWPRYEAYVRADETLSEAKRDLLLLTGEAHEVWLRAAGAR